ncbi:MAG: pantothenate kinase [Gammaproteobacteria bacterium RIFCSPHIGHO2_12_FULL_41_20]|nr:MAG: pantothenate kinase [Gammaproteobacteria bacterium RIFCSPHIGHO2_12_FULL_41_20]
MIICVDIGNTNLYGGVFDKEKLLLQFRYPSTSSCTSDQLGVFFRNVLQENQLDPTEITAIAICSVLPSLNYSIRSAFIKYFAIDPLFLDATNIPELTIHCENPQEVGADRLANAVAATHYFPHQNLIIIDLGTATTFDVVSAQHLYLGGVIMPGIHTAMKSLYENTAKLAPVHIVRPKQIVGNTTTKNIQSGLYFSHLGAMREIMQKITHEVFRPEPVTVLGTGGFCYLFENENVFHKNIPDLVLQGLRLTLQKQVD